MSSIFYSIKALLHVFIADFHDIDSSNFCNRDSLQNEQYCVCNNILNHIKYRDTWVILKY